MAPLTENLIRCCGCVEEFKCAEDLKIHLMMTHLENWTPLKCEKCPAMRLATVQALRAHQQFCHPDWKDKTVVYYYNDEKEEELTEMFNRSLQNYSVQEVAVPFILRSTAKITPIFPLPSLENVKDNSKMAETSKSEPRQAKTEIKQVTKQTNTVSKEVGVKNATGIASTSKENTAISTQDNSGAFEDLSETEEESDNLILSPSSVESDKTYLTSLFLSDTSSSVGTLNSDEGNYLKHLKKEVIQEPEETVSEMVANFDDNEQQNNPIEAASDEEMDNEEEENEGNNSSEFTSELEKEQQKMPLDDVEFIESFDLEQSVEWMQSEEEEVVATSEKMPALIPEPKEATVAVNDAAATSSSTVTKKRTKKPADEQLNSEAPAPKRQKCTAILKMPKKEPTTTTPGSSRQTDKMKTVVSMIMDQFGVHTTPDVLQSSRPFVNGSSGFTFTRDGGMNKWWDGYEYYFHMSKLEKSLIWRWRCSQSRRIQCCGTLHTNKGGIGNETLSIEHNHESDPDSLPARLAVEDMGTEAVTTQKKFSDIVSDCSAKLTPEQVERLPNTDTILRKLRRLRSTQLENQPTEDEIEAKLAVKDMKVEAVRTRKKPEQIIADVSEKLTEEQKGRLSSDSALKKVLLRARKKTVAAASLI